MHWPCLAPPRVYEVDAKGIRQDKPVAVKQWAKELGVGAFRRVTWREGTKQKLWSRFAFRRVVAAADPHKEEVWLAMEWLPDEAGLTKFYLITGHRKLHLRNTVRLFKERYRTERVYEEAKQRWASITTRDAAMVAGTITSRSS